MLSASEKYDLAEAKLKAFTRSAVRTKVMLCLLEQEQNAGDLEKMIGLRTTTILHSIKDMIEEKLITKKDQVYGLTNLGRIQALILSELVSTIVTLDLQEDFWLNHYLGDIPTELQMNLGMLAQSDVIEGDPISLLKAQEYFMEKVIESREICGVSPIIVPGYAEAMAISIKNGAQVDLILTDAILKVVLKEYHDLIKGLMKQENFRLYRIEDDIKIAFTVTDAHLYLGLFRLDGTYDIGQDLFCTGKGAVAWGLDLFKHFRDLSERIK
jgi:predicted transcriptional regulator